MPAAASIPARQSSLADDHELAARRRYPNADTGSWRFVFLAAAFVGALGIGAAMLVREAPRKPPARQAAAQLDNGPLLSPTGTMTVPTGELTGTPIIDMGDLDDGKPSLHPRKAKRAQSPPAPHTAQPAQPAQPAPGAAKTGDLAGPIKVWK
jgi:hypothetical protein